MTLQQQVLSKVNSFDQRLTKVEGVIANSFSELKKLMENEARKNFTVKDSGYEVVYKEQIKLYLHDVLMICTIIQVVLAGYYVCTY